MSRLGSVALQTQPLVTVTDPAIGGVAGATATYDAISLTAQDLITPRPHIKYIANTDTDFTGAGIAAVKAYTLTDYINTKYITFRANTIVKFFAIDDAGNVEQIRTAYCPTSGLTLDANKAAVVPDLLPSVYLNALGYGNVNPPTTSNPTLFFTGNVAPFDAVLDINGPVTTNVADGSFAHQFSALVPLPTATSAALTLGLFAPVIMATSGINVNTLPLPPSVTADYFATIPLTLTTQLSPTTTVSVGSLSAGALIGDVGVIGNTVRLPITFTSGYQADTMGLTVSYDALSLSNPVVEITGAASASGKVVYGGIVQVGTPANLNLSKYQILIMRKNITVSNSLPIPDGVVAYLKFTVAYSKGGIPTAGTTVQPTAPTFEANDLNGTSLTVATPTIGAINIVSKPGNSYTAAVDVPVTLGRVLGAVYMLLDPVTYPVDGSVDLNSNGLVDITEVQRVINSYVGM
jgi:hypothetical protein